MQGRLTGGGVEGAADRLAIEGDGPPLRRLVERLCPCQEAPAEGAGVEEGEDAPEGVVAGDAPFQGQPQPLVQPVPAGLAEAGHVHEALGPAQDGTEGDGEYVEQGVAAGVFPARVRQIGETFLQHQHRRQGPPPTQGSSLYHTKKSDAIALPDFTQHTYLA